MFRFTIRDVLWLTVVVALAAGWWIGNRNWQATAAKSEAELTALHAKHHTLPTNFDLLKFAAETNGGIRTVEQPNGQVRFVHTRDPFGAP